MFVETKNGFINTDHIVTAKRSVGASGEQKLTLRTVGMAEGAAASFDGDELPIEDLCGVIVPAQPGFVLIEAFLPGRGEEDSSVHYVEKAIIAFRVIGGTTAPRPVTLSGEPSDRSNVSWIVLQPDGRCVDFDGICITVEDFKAECEADAARRAAATA